MPGGPLLPIFLILGVGGEAEVSHLFYFLQCWLRKQAFHKLFIF